MTSAKDERKPPDDSDLGLLGQQIALVLRAYQNPDERHYCRVRDGEFPTSDLFTGNGDRRFLAFDSLPGTVNVKAIGVDAKTIFVELTPFDDDRLAETALPDGIKLNGGGLWHGRHKLAHVALASPKVAAEHGPRALWTIPWSKLSPEDLAVTVAALDRADEAGAYVEEPSDVAHVAPVNSTGRMRMELRMDLQLRLIQTQVPILSLSNRLENRLEIGMRLELAQLQRFETWLERNPADAIDAYLKTHPGPEGELRVAKMIEFKMARDVKNTAEASGHDIDWSCARRIVRRLLKRCAA